MKPKQISLDLMVSNWTWPGLKLRMQRAALVQNMLTSENGTMKASWYTQILNEQKNTN